MTVIGGNKLKARLAEISAKLEKKASLKVGFLKGGSYDNGTSLPMVAAIQEFGAPRAGIPPRPYFRPTVAAKSSEWAAILSHEITQDDYNAETAFNRLGMIVKADIQEAISNVQTPPLSPITLMLRKMRSDDPDLIVTGRTVGEAASRVAAGEEIGPVNTKPLNDSGFMAHHVDYEVNAQ